MYSDNERLECFTTIFCMLIHFAKRNISFLMTMAINNYNFRLFCNVQLLFTNFNDTTSLTSIIFLDELYEIELDEIKKDAKL